MEEDQANLIIDDNEKKDERLVEARQRRYCNEIDVKFLKPKDVEIKFAGTNEDGEESAAFLGKAMIGALFLMFIILLTQFNSFYQAAITLSTVVLSTVGALTGLLITGQVFSVIMSGLGIVSLAGIIVNNSIVLIDTFNRLKNDAKSLNEAILHSLSLIHISEPTRPY